jgi:hypothetical protein
MPHTNRFLFFSLICLATVTVNGQITSTFDVDADGWTNSQDLVGTGSVAPVFNSTGGNPGGFISVTYSSVGPPTWYWLAPAKFLGDRCVTSYNKNLKFDIKQSASPTDNTNGDVILWHPTNSRLYHQLPVQPGSSWTSYSLLLNETAGWHYNSPSGPAPTKEEMIVILSNISAIQIRSRHSITAGNISAIDNVVLEVTPPGPAAPVITSFTPVSATPGTLITITGLNFNSTKANNLVYFGNMKAAVQSATATQLTVTVPPGATFGKITATDLTSGLSAQSLQNFNPVFNNNKDFGGKIIASSMDRKFTIDLDASAAKGFVNTGDLDGDGLNDLLVVECNYKKFSVLRNLGITGDINVSSFAAKISFDIGYTSKGANLIADFDGDGKPDVIVGAASGIALLAIFHNTSTPGNISFDPVEYVTASSYSDGSLHAADIDGDGRPDVLSAFNNSCGGAGAYFSIFPNNSTPGNIEFCSYRDFDFGVLCQSDAIATGDLDGDGKTDIAVTSGFNNAFYIFQNTSTPGAISIAAPFLMDSPGSTLNVVIADFDADNKPDLAWKSDLSNDIVLKKNIHSGGALSASSFSAEINLQTPLGNGGTLAVADINGDGKPDLVANDDNHLGIVQNISTPGVLNSASFTSGVIYEGYTFAQVPTPPVIADFDGDNKPDVAFASTNVSPAFVSIYRNECFPAPQISSASLLTGSPGTSMSLNGDLMFTGSVSPIISFGSVHTVTGTTSNTTLGTTVPLGAMPDRIGVTLHGLSDYTDLPFTSTFITSGALDVTTFATSVDFSMTSNTGSMAIGDFDSDGKIDVAAEDNNVLKIFRNTISAAGAPVDNTLFTVLPTTYTGSAQVTAGDFDGDGKTDLFTNSFLKRNNSGSQADPISFEANINSGLGGNRIVTNHDFNKDGKGDIAFTDPGNLVRVVENTSRKGSFTAFPFPSFQTPVSITPGGNVLGIEAADFDGDDYDDIVYAIYSGTTINVHLNTKQEGPITATQFAAAFVLTVGSQPYDLAVADFDNDGKPDIAVSNFNSTFVTVFRNTSMPGTLNFVRQDLTALTKGYAIAAADLNGDGKSELVTIHQTSSTSGSFSVFPNTGTGTISFAARIDYSLPNKPEGLGLADINLDEKTDIIILRNGDFLSVFENKIASGSTITITQQPADQSVCDGDVASFSTAATGTTNITYQWQFATTNAGPFNDISNGGAYSGVLTSTLSVNTTGNFGSGRYRCKINGDLAPTVFTNDEGLFINSVPNAPTATGSSSCTQAALTLNASGGANGQYRWYTAAAGGAFIAAEFNNAYTTPLLTTTTSYYVSLKNGTCESTRTQVTATIVNPTKPVLTFSPNASSAVIDICEGDAQSLIAPAGFAVYTWSNGETTSSIDVTQSGVYSVTVQDGSGCTSPPSDLVTVTVNPYPAAEISMNGSQLLATPGTSYQWYNFDEPLSGQTNQSFEFSLLEYGVYAVDVTDNGCKTHSDNFIYLITDSEKQNADVYVWPNPASEQLNIGGADEIKKIELIDLSGKQISCSQQDRKIDVSGLAKGTYTMIVTFVGKKILYRIVKTN